jgi:photosystem II stability/assembly factor-like uncharacterized protein
LSLREMTVGGGRGFQSTKRPTTFARWRRWIVGTLVTCVVASLSAADLASRTLLLDGAVAGSAVIAVGERGTVLRSTDNAQTWQAVRAPTLATLTGVSFVDAAHGWAVGHDAVILATTDGGSHWTKQWQGENLTDSFLDVLAIDARHVIAIGAYGLYLSTDDAGATWRREKIIGDDYHLNRLSRATDGTLYIAGEHGTVLSSHDEGWHWSGLALPYEGSFYGILPLDGTALLAYGLRGRVYRSADGGATWSEVETHTTSLLATAVRLRSGRVALAGQARALLIGRDDGSPLTLRDAGITTGIAELLPLRDGALLALGESGAQRIKNSPGTFLPEDLNSKAIPGNDGRSKGGSENRPYPRANDSPISPAP